MIIVAGHLTVSSSERNSYVETSTGVVHAAREAPGCLDFSITADTVDPERIWIFERWESEQQLMAFRGTGPSDGQQAAILDADVKRYEIASVGEA